MTAPPIRGSERWRAEYSSTAGLPFDDLALESRIVWIFGSPRTGSTWLVRQICDPADPEPEEPLGFKVPPGAEPLAAVPYNELLISAHIAPKEGPPTRHGDSLLPSTRNLYLFGFNSYAFAESFADVWGPEIRRLTLVRLAAALDRAPSEGIGLAPDPLLVIKEVNGSHAADLIMRLFPRSRMIFLVRDGRDVIDSKIHAHGAGGWMVGRRGPRFRTDVQRLEWVRAECLEWACNIDVSQAAFDAHPAERRYRLRYEDLRGDPVPTLAGLRRWLGLPAGEQTVSEIVRRHAFENVPADKRGANRFWRAARPGLWRSNLTRAEQQTAAEIIGPRLAALGYED